MPICRNCKLEFNGVYRQKYCSIKCRLEYCSEIDNETGCINWKSAISNKGYGVINIKNNTRLAHRIAYENVYGHLLDDILVLHKCDNSRCINVDHLFTGSHEDNMDDMAKKGRAAWSKVKMPAEIRKKIWETRKKNKTPNSKKQIEAASKTMKEKWSDENFKKMMKDKMSGKNNPFSGKMSDERRSKFKDYWESMKGKKNKPHSEETKQKMRDAATKRHIIKNL